MKKKITVFAISYIVVCGLLFSGCTTTADSASVTSTTLLDEKGDVPASDAPAVKGSRDNTPVCLTPAADGITTYDNGTSFLDVSHTDEGYILAKYVGDCPKVKLQITNNGGTTYTYNLVSSDYEAFPLSCGNGTYTIATYENVSGTSYVTALYEEIPVTITDEFRPFLYPNQYVDFDSSNEVVTLASSLVEPANNDLEAVTYIYDYVTNNITYDYSKAETVESGYTCDVDTILQSGTGICLDYAAVMCSMLRSQNIPTQLEVGYAGDTYHAWISVYIKDVGWLNGIIEFDGKSWELLDPTFAAGSSEKDLKKFIGDGSNYTVKYIY